MRGKEESFLMTHEHTIKKNTPTRLSKSKQRKSRGKNDFV